MNKIILDNQEYELVNGVNNIEINGNSSIFIVNLEYDLTINMCDNSKLDIYCFNLKNVNSKLNIIQNNNTVFNFNHTFKIDGEYLLDIVANINGDNNVNNINIYGISNGDVRLLVDGIVKSGTKNNILDENIKVLTIDGKCFTKPMMHINVKECIANHNTAISNVREDQVFYLMSKGLTRDDAVKLISDGYLYGLFKDKEDFLNKII